MKSDNDNGRRSGDATDVARTARLLLQLEQAREQLKMASERARRVQKGRAA